ASLVLAVPVIYLMISVRRYFTFRRAFGIDHFDAEFRTLPMERRGIFHFSPNAMYVFGFLLLWMPAFLFQSSAALGIAAFSHAYIWVHYFATEKPDTTHIYG
ncbi:MAG: methyltransferase, partial [Rhodospirillales bacterium]